MGIRIFYHSLHGSEARPHPTGNGHCAGAAMGAGITQNPENGTFRKAEVAGKREVTRSENETGNVNILEYVTNEKEAKEEMF